MHPIKKNPFLPHFLHTLPNNTSYIHKIPQKYPLIQYLAPNQIKSYQFIKTISIYIGEIMYTALSEEINKLHVYINLLATVILSVFCVVDMALEDWFEYCYWNIGLVKANPFGDYFSGESTIADAHDDACDSSDVKTIIEHLCPDLCDNLKHSELSGGFLITFGVFTIISFIFVFLLHLLLLCKKRVNMRFTWTLLFAPILFWLLGFVLYCSIIQTSDIRGTKDIDDEPNKKTWKFLFGRSPSDFQMEGGMIFAIIILIFMAFHLAHGLIFTRRYL